MRTIWTKKEDTILKEEISKSPNNLANAFRNASKRLKSKKFGVCSARWYNVLSKQDKVFSLESDNSSVINTKNGVNKQPKSSIPDKNSSREELLEYVIKNYPIGTVCKSPYSGDIFIISKPLKISRMSYIFNDNMIVFDINTNKWAKIISKPCQSDTNTQEVKPKQKGVFFDINKLESLSIQFLRELAVTKLVDVDKKKLIDLIIE